MRMVDFQKTNTRCLCPCSYVQCRPGIVSHNSPDTLPHHNAFLATLTACILHNRVLFKKSHKTDLNFVFAYFCEISDLMTLIMYKRIVTSYVKNMLFRDEGLQFLNVFICLERGQFFYLYLISIFSILHFFLTIRLLNDLNNTSITGSGRVVQTLCLRVTWLYQRCPNVRQYITGKW